jgi:hypothetical protein
VSMRSSLLSAFLRLQPNSRPSMARPLRLTCQALDESSHLPTYRCRRAACRSLSRFYASSVCLLCATLSAPGAIRSAISDQIYHRETHSSARGTTGHWSGGTDMASGSNLLQRAGKGTGFY